ncbi:MAG: MjaI family restriction endonuclease, partial [Bacteroidota bacterium]
EAFDQLTLQDCIDYIFNLTINRTFDGFLREKSVIEDNLAKVYPQVRFEESDPDLDHAGDIDYLGWIGEKAFGIQIKPVTAKANFGNYSATERMRASFEAFTNKYGGKVFIVFSVDDKIQNEEVVPQISAEIKRMSK